MTQLLVTKSPNIWDKNGGGGMRLWIGTSTFKTVTTCIQITNSFNTVSVFSHSEDPSILKFLIFNKKIGKFFEFCHSQSPFSPEFELFTSKISFKMAAL